MCVKTCVQNHSAQKVRFGVVSAIESASIELFHLTIAQYIERSVYLDITRISITFVAKPSLKLDYLLLRLPNRYSF